jgi:hypothetical protein
MKEVENLETKLLGRTKLSITPSYLISITKLNYENYPRIPVGIKEMKKIWEVKIIEGMEQSQN